MPQNKGMPSVEEEVGAQMRHLRKSSGLTITKLAARANISIGLLSKIETGKVLPSLSTLIRLARELNTSMSSLFAKIEKRYDCTFVKAERGVRVDGQNTNAGQLRNFVGRSLDGNIEVESFLVTLKSGAEPRESFRRGAVELIYLLSGKVGYRHADETHALGPGDTLFFDAGTRHGPEKLIEAPARYLSIVIAKRV
jgi:transcriptional regulator with XRE-family HTH domain